MLDTSVARNDNRPQVRYFPLGARSGASLLLWQPADICCSLKVVGVAVPAPAPLPMLILAGESQST